MKAPTAEQIRIAQITEISTGSDDPKMREKVASLMETTQRTEEEVCCALYECDNDLDRAVIFLLETLPVVSIFFHCIAFCTLYTHSFASTSIGITKWFFCCCFDKRVHSNYHPKRKKIV